MHRRFGSEAADLLLHVQSSALLSSAGDDNVRLHRPCLYERIAVDVSEEGDACKRIDAFLAS